VAVAAAGPRLLPGRRRRRDPQPLAPQSLPVCSAVRRSPSRRERWQGNGGRPRTLPGVATRRNGTAVKLEELLETARRITLLGPGGGGKSRLAMEDARGVASNFEDGIRLTELAPLVDARMVPQAVAAAFGVREQPGRPLLATLADMLRLRQVLIVLDNCEQVLSGCTELVLELLRSCSELRFLTTSRRILSGVSRSGSTVTATISIC